MYVNLADDMHFRPRPGAALRIQYTTVLVHISILLFSITYLPHPSCHLASAEDDDGKPVTPRAKTHVSCGNQVRNRIPPASRSERLRLSLYITALVFSCFAASLIIAGRKCGLADFDLLDDDLPSLDEASTSVDALVADDEQGKSRLGTPQQPLHPFGLPPGIPAAPGFRVGTPSAPPGLGFPPGTPMGMSPLFTQAGLAGTSSAAPGSQLPATPGQVTQAPIGPIQGGSKGSTLQADARQNVRAMAVDSGLSKDIASQARQDKGKGVLQEEDFPALDSRKSGAVSRPTSISAPISVPTPKSIAATPKKGRAELAGTPSKPERVSTPKPEKASTPKPERVSTPSKPEQAASPSKPERTAPAKSEQEKRGEKRPAAGVLNIAAATKTVQTKQPDTTPIEKLSAGTSASASSSAAVTPVTASATVARPGTPASNTGTSTSTTSRGIAKTLRLVSTPKAEVPPNLAQASQSLASIPSATAARISRPGTPPSEAISESASMVSASVPTSRASSPPPSKIVGSAAVRITTKSQQRKQRKEATKGIAEAVAGSTKEEEHAPVLGRKKKQKKEKPAKKAEASTSAAKDVPEKAEPEPEPKASPVKKGREARSKAKTKTKEAAPPPPPVPEPAAAPVRPEPEKPFERPEPTPESIFRELSRDGLDPEKTGLLQPVTNYLARTVDAYQANKTTKLRHMKDLGVLLQTPLTSHEEVVLRAGKPIRRVESGQRVLVTPYGDVLHNLTEEEEDRYLALQERVSKHANDPAAFKSDRHRMPGGDFSIVEGRMVANGPPSFFPQGEDDLPESYQAKIRREETLDFMSQFYVPGMRLGSRTLLGEEWLEEVEDKAAVEIMHGLKAMFHSQKHLEAVVEGAGAAGGVAAAAAAVAAGRGTKVIGSDSLPRFLGNEGRAPLRPLAMGFDELERGVVGARREAERYEKVLGGVIKRNRRILTG